MKRILALAAAAAVVAFVLLRPLAPHAAPGDPSAPGWSRAPAPGWSGAPVPGSSGAAASGWSGAAPPGRPRAFGPGGFVQPAGDRDARADATPAPPSTALVYVAGEVRRPGVYAIGPGARARDAVRLAGGALPGADMVAVNLAAHVADGEELVVPKVGAEPPPGARKRSSRAGPPGHRRAGNRKRGKHRLAADGGPTTRTDGGLPPVGLVDLNAADSATLSTVPGIGPGMAERIVAFRETNGPFATVDELLDVSGITDRRLDAILPYVVAR